MDIRVFAAGHGDCVLLSTEKGHILIDGGMPNSYKNHWAQHVADLRDRGEELDLVCISHVDRDHIGGILSMLNNEKEWRLHAVRESLPSNLRPPGGGPNIPRPAKIDAIWHNSFFDEIRKSYISDRKVDALNTIDISEIFSRASTLMAGSPKHDFDVPGKAGSKVTMSGAKVSRRMKFLGQSVAEAIDVSRRIHEDQLDIDLNPQFDGDYVTRTKSWYRVAGMTIRVLGPTKTELHNFVSEWRTYLKQKAIYLAGKARKHDRIDDHLADGGSVEGVLESARSNAIEFAGSQTVTPANMASIVMHVKRKGKSILLTGDADEGSILAGLKHTGLIKNNRPCFIDILKVPHHGADNSYSIEFARNVLARHYVFCSDGANTNPEIRVMRGFLENLFGDFEKGIEACLDHDKKVKFWFNFSRTRAQGLKKKIRDHWDDMVEFVEDASQKYGDRFEYAFLEQGDSFLIR